MYDDAVFYEMFVGIQGLAFIGAQFIEIKIIRIFIVNEFTKITPNKFLCHSIPSYVKMLLRIINQMSNSDINKSKITIIILNR